MEHIFNELNLEYHYFDKYFFNFNLDLFTYLYQNLYDENNIFTEDLKITLTNNGEFI
jgi:hypothetical protein